MLTHWCKPPARSLWTSADHAHRVGRGVEVLTEAADQVTTYRVALFGTDESADRVRTALYAMTAHAHPLPIIDLGNLRNPTPGFGVGLVEELLAAGLIPLWIGGANRVVNAARAAHQKIFTRTALCEAHPRGGQNEGEATTLTDSLRYTHLGGQAHQLPHQRRTALDARGDTGLSLGQLRTNLERAEPLIRNADWLGVHAGVLRESCLPTVAQPSAVGLTVEELCQLAFYGGISDRLVGCSIDGWLPERDADGRSTRAVATVLWYFLDGVAQRKGDFPVSKTHMTEYVVSPAEGAGPLTFWKSERSGRWWVEVEETARPQSQKQLLACNYEDYERAVNGTLTAYLLALLHRFV